MKRVKEVGNRDSETHVGLMFYLSDIPCARLPDAFLIFSDVVVKPLLQDIKINYNGPYYSWFCQANNNTPLLSFTDLKVPTYLKDGLLKCKN